MQRRYLNDLAVVSPGNGQERHVGRGGDDHGRAGPGQVADGGLQRAEDRVGGPDPAGLNCPAVTSFLEPGQGFGGGVLKPVGQVPQHPVADGFLQALGHHGGGTKIHFCYPGSLRRPIARGAHSRPLEQSGLAEVSNTGFKN
ncbi:hypothetical protein SDC9_209691 [bioreactor metagenome]|uniref:Uncharacterized protein n=1 Tax=bioreactor metagenome TaxID=1076179 RepID=A0A645JDZ1_9ZZZZ